MSVPPMRFAAVATLMLLVVAAHALALAPGDLDPTFGSGGSVHTSLAASYTAAVTCVVQPDGRIVALATVDDDIALVRYLPDGSLDGSFGVGGVVITDLGAYDAAQDVFLRPDGGIVAVATTHSSNASDQRLALVHYHADGAPDLAYGAGGVATISPRTTGSSRRITPSGRRRCR